MMNKILIMNINQEKKKTEKEKEFLDNYTDNYKEYLGVNIKDYSTEELTTLEHYEESSIEQKKENKLKQLWKKLMNLL